jgi:hypothetical protein
MPKGKSGRIVIEVSPTLKRQLYSALAIENQTLKDWFISSADRFLKNTTAPEVTPPPTQSTEIDI